MKAFVCTRLYSSSTSAPSKTLVEEHQAEAKMTPRGASVHTQDCGGRPTHCQPSERERREGARDLDTEVLLERAQGHYGRGKG